MISIKEHQRSISETDSCVRYRIYLESLVYQWYGLVTVLRGIAS